MLSNDNSFEAFLRKPRGDKQIHIHFSRNVIIAIILSLIVHALILVLVVPQINSKQASAPLPRSLVVSLAPPIPLPEPPVLKTPAAEPPPVQQTTKKLPSRKPKVIVAQPKLDAIPPEFSVPKEIVADKPKPEVVPPLAELNKEISAKAKPSESEAPVDMQAYVNHKRAAREAAEADAVKQNAEAVARENGPTEETRRDAKIKRNFQNGTNGIFEITRLESRSASFTFLGWTSSLSNARREFFEVEASSGQDVRHLMIRRMIGLIRTHYQGDFDWESRRLNRTIVKSARVEDGAELEDFLMQEFFGTNYKAAF